MRLKGIGIPLEAPISVELRGTMRFRSVAPGVLDLAFDFELVQPLFWSKNGVQYQALPFDRGEIARGEESHEQQSPFPVLLQFRVE